MDAHAQLEIRLYAETMGREIIAPLLPLCWEAFLGYRLVGGWRWRRWSRRSSPGSRPPARFPPSDVAFLAAGDPAGPAWPAAANAPNAAKSW